MAEKSDEFFKQEENSLGGRLLMAKYDKMNEANRQESEKKMQLALAEIRRTASEGLRYQSLTFPEIQGCRKDFL